MGGERGERRGDRERERVRYIRVPKRSTPKRYTREVTVGLKNVPSNSKGSHVFFSSNPEEF